MDDANAARLVTGSEEYFISFDTRIDPGKLVAVRVRLDQVTLTDMKKPLAIDLVNHPLYRDLEAYILANNETKP